MACGQLRCVSLKCPIDCGVQCRGSGLPKLPVPVHPSFCPSKIHTHRSTVAPSGYGRLPAITFVGSSSNTRPPLSAPYTVAERVSVYQLGGCGLEVDLEASWDVSLQIGSVRWLVTLP